MSIYKPSLLDKFKDFVNGLKSNWDAYEDHVADFESHLADSAAHIEDQGSNTNGEYIRFKNGLQICFMIYSDSVTTTISAGALYGHATTTLAYPSAFLSRPNILSVTSEDSRFVSGQIYANTITNNSVRIMALYSMERQNSSDTFYITLIGR